MFRRLYEALTRVIAPRTPLRDLDFTQAPRAPDPYVWRLPTPYDARWRRWSKRSRAAAYCLPFLPEEACWQTPPLPQLPPWQSETDPARPYVQGASGMFVPHR